jgi:glycosyltransferase involved in cell wall biosynthesis
LSDSFKPIFKCISLLINPTKLITIHNPLTINHCISKEQIKKEKICLFVGRLAKEKGVDMLLKIWCIVESKLPEWKLVIAGDGEERPWMETYVLRHHLKRVEFIGFQADMSYYYRKSYILTMSSIFEGWLLALSEAMCFGAIPITFNSYASAKDIIDNTINGFLITSFSISEYTETLLHLCQNTCLLEQMSRKAIEKSKIFTISNIVPKWEDLFSSLMV